jgi:ectoine hydroxylase-related dioxygenase (phytanoyl-CoA dioxygenase family)
VSVLTAPPSPVSLPPATIEQFQRDGFAVIERVTDLQDLARIAQIMARLYRRYPGLARQRQAWELGVGTSDRLPEILGINQTTELEPELETTLVFQRCRALAEVLLGRPVEHRFDHAIYKPAFNGRATAWHQDEAYTLDPGLVTAHFWIPMQDVTRDMGCMEFIPGSHRDRRIRPHHRLEHLRHAHALETEQVDASRAVACPIRAGDVTVHFARTLHYTGPNVTAVPRLAWSVEFGPRRPLPLRLVAKARLMWRLQARRFGAG